MATMASPFVTTPSAEDIFSSDFFQDLSPEQSCRDNWRAQVVLMHSEVEHSLTKLGRYGEERSVNRRGLVAGHAGQESASLAPSDYVPVCAPTAALYQLAEDIIIRVVVAPLLSGSRQS